MNALSGPLQVVALTLIVSGMIKILDPRPSQEAMRSAGIPVGTGVLPGRLLGSVELLSGLALFVVPGRTVAAWFAVLHLGLFGFVLALLRRDPTASCGCLGRASAPPTRAHAGLNLAIAAIAAVAAVLGVDDPIRLLDEPALVVPHVVLVVTGAGLLLFAPALLAERSAVVIGRTPRRFGVGR